MNVGFVVCKITEKDDVYYGDWDRGRPIAYFETKKEAHRYVRALTDEPFTNEWGTLTQGSKYSVTNLLTWKEYAINDAGKWFNIKYS